MRPVIPAVCLAVVALTLLSACGGTTVLPGSAFHSPYDTTVSATTPGPADDPSPSGPTPLEPPPGTPGPTSPFTVVGKVRMDARQGVDARKEFNDCQRAAAQHAADTLDPSFDPTPLCVRKKGSSCSGIGPYAGIRTGAAVRITDSTGTVIGTGRLGPGALDRPLTLTGPTPTCDFGFTVAAVPGGFSSYGVDVGPARSTFAPAGAGSVDVPVHDE